MTKFKNKQIKLGKGQLQIVTIKFNDVKPFHEPDEDFEDQDELSEFDLID